jgi:1-deoxy-D-xylulose-5-phosphate reductoisomerase
MQKLTLLGSTGSVGTSALAVIRAHPERFTIIALSGGRNVEAMLAQCLEFRPVVAVMADPHAAQQLRAQLAGNNSMTQSPVNKRYAPLPHCRKSMWSLPPSSARPA